MEMGIDNVHDAGSRRNWRWSGADSLWIIPKERGWLGQSATASLTVHERQPVVCYEVGLPKRDLIAAVRPVS